MKILFILFLAMGIPMGSARADLFDLGIEAAKSEVEPNEATIPFAARSDPYSEFRDRLIAAIESKRSERIKELYQPATMNDAAWEIELGVWTRLATPDPSQQPIQCWFKDFALLPPKVLQFWTKQAENRTTHKVTHIAFVRTASFSSTFPLIDDEGTLRIVCSDKVSSSPARIPKTK